MRNFLGLVVLLTCGQCLAIIFQAVVPVLPGISEYFGGGSAGIFAAQMMMTLPSIGLIFGPPIAGVFSRYFGSRNVLLAALGLFSALGLAGLVISDRTTLLASRLALGLAGGGIATGATALIGERWEGAQRARMLGLHSGFSSAFGLVFLLLSGLIAEMGNWRTPFAIYGIGFIFLVAAALSIDSAPLAGIARTGSRRADLKPLWWLYLAIVALWTVAWMTNAQTSFLLTEDGITGSGVQSRVISASLATNMISGWSYGWIRTRLAPSSILMLCLAAMSAGITTIGLSHGPMTVAIGCGLTGAAVGALGPYFFTFISETAAPESRGQAIGLAYACMFVGDFFNPLVMTPLHAALGIHSAFIAVGVTLTVVTVASTMLRLKPARL
ncbi:MAG: transporter [Rhodospirillales bacterium]|nr:transporter [Rhodospirillales bacterium]